jgi:hypothetical protein
MDFRFKKSYDYYTQTIIQVGKVSGNLILLNIALESYSLKLDSRPLHKRYKFGDFPPLDVSFDSETGMIKELTIFIRKKDIDISKSSKKVDSIISLGYPCFEFSNLEKHEYYYDEECKAEILVYGSTLDVRLFDEQVQGIVQVNDSLSIILNNENKYIGFLYNKLTEDAVNLLIN